MFNYIILLVLINIVAATPQYCITQDKNGKLKLVRGVLIKSISWGSYDNSVNSTGWGVLNIHTNPDYPPKLQAYCAGYLESFFTHELMYDYWHNYQANEYDAGMSYGIKEFMMKQYKWWKYQIEHNENDVYWQQQRLIYEQFKGLVDGFEKYHKGNEKLTMDEIYYLNSVGDLPTITNKVEEGSPSTSVQIPEFDVSIRNLERKHPDEVYHECSAFVKYNDKSNEVIFSHNSWRPYYAMLRIYKHYLLPYTKNAKPVSFSSSPGLIHSKDDFYTLYGGKVNFGVMETTNTFYIKQLYQKIVPSSLLSWQRILQSIYFGDNLYEVAKLVGKYNSGTYNNQWMFVNLNETDIKNKQHMLYIGEQMPGLYLVKDVTDVLINQTYWASYNIPSIPEIYTKSGYSSETDEYANNIQKRWN